MTSPRRVARSAAAAWSAGRTRFEAIFGGPARMRVILLLAAVLAVNSADLGTVGAVARQLQADLGINHTELGLLATMSSGVGALATIPMGALADRVVRVRLLVVMIVLWSAALAVGGAALSYLWLLLSRLALGGALAAAGPLLASLIGDLFPVDERARVYGLILTGEMIGAGVGLLAGGDIAMALSWRYAFWLLALLSVALAVAVLQWLPEPARGGASRLPPGSAEIEQASRVRLFGRDTTTGGDRSFAESLAWGELWAAFRYILRIRTILILIVASSIGYFFFAGLRTFGVVFVERHFGIGAGELSGLVLVVGAAALAGAVLGGRLADRLLERGHEQSRIVVPAVAYSLAAILFAPGLLTTSVLVALPFFAGAAAMLSAANPPLDAARLDLVPSTLWGRAESARTVLRLAAEALAPLCFGIVADQLARAVGQQAAAGLRDTFLIMLLPLLANGLIVFAGRRSYLPDVRHAEATEARSR